MNSQMIHRLTASIENGNVARIAKWTAEKSRQVAKEALDATNWKSYAAAYRYLDGKRIAHD